MSTTTLVVAGAAVPLPPAGVLLRCAQIAMDEDRPIQLDYWNASHSKLCCIGVKEGVKYLVKSDNEYTSTIEDIKKVDGCYLILTENSLYLVSQNIPVRKIVTSAITASI